jgi:hypothetical protein
VPAGVPGGGDGSAMQHRLDHLRVDQQAPLRLLGGVALFAASLTLFVRKSIHHEWGSCGRLLILGVPCAILLTLALELHQRRELPALDRGLLVRAKRAAPAWQAVILILGLTLFPVALFQFVGAVGGNTGDGLNAAWIFLLTAAVGLYTSFATGVTYGSLIAGLSLVLSWITFWNKLSSPSLSTDRWLLLAVAAALVLAAFRIERENLSQASDLVTASGVAALLAGILGLLGAGAAFVTSSITRSLGGPFAALSSGPRQHHEWDAMLLALSAVLIWYGSRRGARGPVYVGSVALAAFVLSVGSQLASLFALHPANGSLARWPLILFLVAAAALGVGFRRPRRPDAQEPTPQVPPSSPA